MSFSKPLFFQDWTISLSVCGWFATFRSNALIIPGVVWESCIYINFMVIGGYGQPTDLSTVGKNAAE